jgi:hypothetical protein
MPPDVHPAIPTIPAAIRHKIERQTRDGVLIVGWLIESIPQLTCLLPAKRTMERVRNVGRVLHDLPYPNLLRTVHGEFTAFNQSQGDTVIAESANIAAIVALRRHPLFGAEFRALLEEVRRTRRNLGLTVVADGGQFAFGVGTGVANVALTMVGTPQEPETFPTPAAQASGTWRTRADPTMTSQYGLPETHVAMFEPVPERGGLNHTVSIMIPETSQIERRLALSMAVKARARTSFICDSGEQAEAMAAYAAPLLPGHRRIAYERAEAGQWGRLV